MTGRLATAVSDDEAIMPETILGSRSFCVDRTNAVADVGMAAMMTSVVR